MPLGIRTHVGSPDYVGRGKARQPFTYVNLEEYATGHMHVGTSDYVGHGKARQPFIYVKLDVGHPTTLAAAKPANPSRT